MSLRIPTARAKAAERFCSSFPPRTNEDSVALAFDDLDSSLLSLQALCHLPITSRVGTEEWSLSLHRCANGMEMSKLASRQRVPPAGCRMVYAVEETALHVGCGRQPGVQSVVRGR